MHFGNHWYSSICIYFVVCIVNYVKNLENMSWILFSFFIVTFLSFGYCVPCASSVSSEWISTVECLAKIASWAWMVRYFLSVRSVLQLWEAKIKQLPCLTWVFHQMHPNYRKKLFSYIPYALHYNPRFVYFLPHFSLQFIL